MKDSALNEKITQYAETHRESLVNLRRSLHQIPELTDDLPKTRKMILDYLKKFKDIEIRDWVGNGGITALLRGDLPGKTFGYRADMDALPMEEMNEVPYKSTHPGKMHACGHDAHMTIALGILTLLHAFKSELRGQVKFIFQPAEEAQGGALEMIQDGALKDPEVDEIYGIHVWPSIEKGRFGLKAGELMAGTDIIRIDIQGKGGHPGIPHHAVNPIVVGSKIVSELESITSYAVDSSENAVISICSFHGGKVNNIIPHTVTIYGTVRTFNAETQDIVEREMSRIVHHFGDLYRATCTLDYHKHFPPTINHPEVIAKFKDSLDGQAVPGAVENLSKPSMGAEDFSCFLREKPGAFIFVGTRNEAKGLVHEIHHPQFDIDEDILTDTALAFARFFISSQ
ncbi:MAG: hypothetical protein AVO33_06145 [delta proteobacterium ML8_F1]|nr:MAG: hypothetical protein AVO33_06145 [delta proteobacterium ML8_F1]